jgi:hypothetical protein
MTQNPTEQRELPTFIRTEGKPYGQYLAHHPSGQSYVVVAWSPAGKWSVGKVSVATAVSLQESGCRYEPQRVPVDAS